MEFYKFPIPRIEAMLQKLMDFKFFLELDLAEGFNQLRISKALQQIFTFTCSKGKVSFKSFTLWSFLGNSYFSVEYGWFILWSSIQMPTDLNTLTIDFLMSFQTQKKSISHTSGRHSQFAGNQIYIFAEKNVLSCKPRFKPWDLSSLII